MKHGKKYVDAAKLIDKTKAYDSKEAIDVCLKTGTAKFDETVELHVKLGVDSRHADQQVRGAIVLPNGTGKQVRVLAICKGDNVQKAQEAGAEYVGAEEFTQKIQSEGWTDFDVLITTPDMMGLVGRLENFDALINAIIKAKPAAAKGQYIKSVAVATTMGPAVKVNPAKINGAV